MKWVLGPFSIDPNISNPVVDFDGTLWYILRTCINDMATCEYGIVQLEDVRMFRSRPRTFGEVPDTETEVPKNCWFVEQESSAFLDNARTNDPQRTASALGTHRHFVLFDGSGMAIDAIARTATMRQRTRPLNISISQLIEVDGYEW